jgi:hypothetical protein
VEWQLVMPFELAVQPTLLTAGTKTKKRSAAPARATPASARRRLARVLNIRDAPGYPTIEALLPRDSTVRVLGGFPPRGQVHLT